MEKVEFKEGQLVTAGYVEIDGVKHTVVEPEYKGETPLSPFLLNKIQDNTEKELITAKTTEYAEELTIKDSAPVNGVINIKGGKSVQKTTKGNQLVDFGNASKSNADSTFENDILTVASQIDKTYNYISYDITEHIKNNIGKVLYFDFEKLDVSNFNSTSGVIAQLAIKKSSSDAWSYHKTIDKSGDKYEYTIPDDITDTASARLQIYANNSGTYYDSTVIITKPMLQFGTDELEYEQYTGGIASPNINYRQEVERVGDNGSITVYNQNKNHFQLPSTYTNKGIEYTNNGNGTFNLKGTATDRADFVMYVDHSKNGLINGETYAFSTSKDLQTGTHILVEAYNDTTWVRSVMPNNLSSASKLSIGSIDLSGSNRIRYTIRVNAGATVDLSNIEILLEKSDTVTEFVQHQSQLITVPMQKPFGEVGDIRDRFVKVNEIDYEEHLIYRKIFDGTEEWAMDYGTSLFNSKISNISTVNLGMSNCFTFDTRTAGMSSLSDNTFAMQPQYGSIFFKCSECTTVEEWKTKLTELYNAGTPLYVDYILATPELIECTEEQKEALYQLEHIQMYENLTYITCTDEIKPEIKATYLYNNDLNKYYGTRLDAIESRLHILEKG